MSASLTEIAHEFGISALWQHGMYGEGVAIAMLDSGVRKEDIGSALAWEVNLTDADDPRDVVGHGTKMAKFALFCAPKSSIVSIKVINDANVVTRETAARGVQLCQQRYPEIHIVNMSLGIPRRSLFFTYCTHETPCVLCSQTNDTVNRGLIAVAAVGNEGPEEDTITCPGYAANSFSIAALDTRPLPLQGTPPGKEGETGTSVSAALVSGGLALLRAALPDVAPLTIREALEITATRLNEPANVAGAGGAHFYRTYKWLQHARAGNPIDLQSALQHWETGKALADRGDTRGSMHAFEQAVALAPTNSTFHNSLGVAYRSSQDLERAVATLQEAVWLDWTSDLAHWNLAGVLLQMERRQEAVEHISAHLHYARQDDADLDALLKKFGE